MYEDQFKEHERAIDRERQQNAVQQFVSGTRLTYSIQPTGSRYDADLYDGLGGPLVAILEFKWRNNSRLAYPTYRIDKEKIDFLLSEAQMRSTMRIIIPYLLVSWQGDLWYSRLDKHDFSTVPVVSMKRNDRNEFVDQVYEIPLSFFNKK